MMHEEEIDGSAAPHTDAEIVDWVIRRWTRMGGGPDALGDIAVGSLMAAKLVLRFAFVAGLDFDANPEALASMEKMSDETALGHMPPFAGAARRRWGAGPPSLPHLMKTEVGWRWTARDAASVQGQAGGELSEGAERLFGDIMGFLGRSRVLMSDGGIEEAQECFAQILAMMAVPKVVFTLLGDAEVASATESLADRLADKRYLESTGPLQWSSTAARAADVGWVLAGGGARGAYEVGVLGYLFDRIGRDLDGPLPLDIVCGTSIGAIHACALATWADDPHVGMRVLERRWGELSLDSVISLDRRRSFNMIRALLGWPLRQPSADAERGGVLDPRPLEMLLASMMDARRVAGHLRDGRLQAVSVTATHVGTGRTTVFFQRAGGGDVPWRGGRASARSVTLTSDHALASAAIPFLFPAVRIDDELYCDGSLRQHVPLSPARLLGARALVVINPRAAAGNLSGEPTAAERERAFPGPLFLLGKTLNALTLDRIDADVEHLELVNRLLGAGERRFGPRFVREINATLAETGAAEVRPIPLLQIGASEDIGELAAEFVRSPRFRRRCSGLIERAFSRLAEGEAANEADLLSYLLFDGAFAGELIALGRRDARRRHDEIVEFFRAEANLQHRPRLQLADGRGRGGRER